MRTFWIAAFAASLTASAAQAETLVVGVENLDYLPHYSSEAGEYSGFGAAVLNAFATDEGLTLEYRILPVARLFQTFVDGGVDLKYPDNAYWAAELKEGADVVYSEPVTPYIDGVMVSPTKLGTPADSYSQLGIVAGFTAWDWLDRIEGGQVALAENASLDGLVRQALAGRVPAVYANVAVMKARLRQLNEPDSLVFDDSLPHTKSAYHLSATARSDVVERFDAWMAANGDRMTALRDEYRVGEAYLR